eukprot:5166461-Prymnesium_polylepis.1
MSDSMKLADLELDRPRTTSIVRRVGARTDKSLLIAVAMMVFATLCSLSTTIAIDLTRPIATTSNNQGGAILRDHATGDVLLKRISYYTTTSGDLRVSNVEYLNVPNEAAGSPRRLIAFLSDGTTIAAEKEGTETHIAIAATANGGIKFAANQTIMVGAATHSDADLEVATHGRSTQAHKKRPPQGPASLNPPMTQVATVLQVRDKCPSFKCPLSERAAITVDSFVKSISCMHVELWKWPTGVAIQMATRRELHQSRRLGLFSFFTKNVVFVGNVATDVAVGAARALTNNFVADNCLFLHGLLVNNGGLHELLTGVVYWHNVKVRAASLCRHTYFPTFDTVTRGSDNATLQNEFYDWAKQFQGPRDRVFAHSMGNVILAKACIDQNKCLEKRVVSSSRAAYWFGVGQSSLRMLPLPRVQWMHIYS